MCPASWKKNSCCLYNWRKSLGRYVQYMAVSAHFLFALSRHDIYVLWAPCWLRLFCQLQQYITHNPRRKLKGHPLPTYSSCFGKKKKPRGPYNSSYRSQLSWSIPHVCTDLLGRAVLDLFVRFREFFCVGERRTKLSLAMMATKSCVCVCVYIRIRLTAPGTKKKTKRSRGKSVARAQVFCSRRHIFRFIMSQTIGAEREMARPGPSLFNPERRRPRLGRVLYLEPTRERERE